MLKRDILATVTAPYTTTVGAAAAGYSCSTAFWFDVMTSSYCGPVLPKPPAPENVYNTQVPFA